MKNFLKTILMTILAFIVLNYYAYTKMMSYNFSILIFILLFVILSIFVMKKSSEKDTPRKISALQKGNNLLIIFFVSCSIEVVVTLIVFYKQENINYKILIIHILIVVLTENVIFWGGMIRCYIFSVQLGIKWRIIGILCGWIPVLHVLALLKIINITKSEISFEKGKYNENMLRAENLECKTKYPILLVHGVFFRDLKLFNYWGRVPDYLIKNGANIYYGNHDSASSVEESGIEISKRIDEIVSETQCEKVNIIAHSKGGLDCRCAISSTLAGKHVASLTTINTPHYGCLFADNLLNKISDKTQKSIAMKYNAALKKLGDKNPDFLKAVNCLTTKACLEFNKSNANLPEIYYQSVGSKMNKARSGRFPLNIAYPLVKHFDGENDGLVSVESMQWGENFTLIKTNKRRGISHGDIIDLNRENIPGFDVREFYFNIVKDLKLRGL